MNAVDLGSNNQQLNSERLAQTSTGAQLKPTKEESDVESSTSGRSYDELGGIENRISDLGELKRFTPSPTFLSLQPLVEQRSELIRPKPRPKRTSRRRFSAPDLAKVDYQTMYPDFLVNKQYPSSTSFNKKIRFNPETDLVMCRGVSGTSTMSSTRSLELTQVQKNFYYSNIRAILEEVLKTWFEGFTDTLVSLIMEYVKNARCVSFRRDAKFYLVDPVGSEHRMMLHAYNIIPNRDSLDFWNMKREVSAEEKKQAEETVAELDLKGEFPDAY